MADTPTPAPQRPVDGLDMTAPIGAVSSLSPEHMDILRDVQADVDQGHADTTAAVDQAITAVEADVNPAYRDVTLAINSAIGAIETDIDPHLDKIDQAVSKATDNILQDVSIAQAEIQQTGVHVPYDVDTIHAILSDETGGMLLDTMMGNEPVYSGGNPTEHEPAAAQTPSEPIPAGPIFSGNDPVATAPTPVSDPVSPPPPPPPVATDDPCAKFASWPSVPAIDAAGKRGTCKVQPGRQLPGPGQIVQVGGWEICGLCAGGYDIIPDPGSSTPAVPPVSPPPPASPPAVCIPVCPPPPCGCSGSTPPPPPPPAVTPEPTDPDDEEPETGGAPADPTAAVLPSVDLPAWYTGSLCTTIDDTITNYARTFPWVEHNSVDEPSAASTLLRNLVAVGNTIADRVFASQSATAKSESLKQSYVLAGDWLGGYSQAVTVIDILSDKSLKSKSAVWSLGVTIGAAEKANASSGIPVSYLTQGLVYTFQSLNPQFIPSQAEMDELLIQGLWTSAQWVCGTKMLGNIPEIRSDVIRAKRPVLTPDQIVSLQRRGGETADLAPEQWQRSGYGDLASQVMWSKLNEYIPGPGDLVSFMVRDTFDGNVVAGENLDKDFEAKFYGPGGVSNPGPAAQWATAQGMTPDVFRQYWRAHWHYPSNTQLYEMLHRLRFDVDKSAAYQTALEAWTKGGKVGAKPTPPPVVTVDDVRRVLEINDVAPNWVEPLIAISYHPITRTDAIDAFHAGAFDRVQLKNAMLDNGYTDADAERLVVIQEYKRARRTANLSGVWTIRKILSAYKRGELTSMAADSLLVPLITDPAQRQSQIAGADREVQSQLKGEQIKTIRRGFFVAALEYEDARKQLGSIGVADDQSVMLLETWLAQRAGRYREPSTRNIIQWVTLGILNPQQATERLLRLGYMTPDIEAMVYSATIGQADRVQQKLDQAEAKLRRVVKDQKDAHRAADQALKDRQKALEKEQKERQAEMDRIQKELAKRSKPPVDGGP